MAISVTPIQSTAALPASASSKAASGGSTQATGSSSQADPELEYLRRRDREVRAHEQAHVAAGGSLVRGAASFGYKTGSDGKQYAVSGEVSIDVSPVEGDPRATMRKMDQVRKAALAPAQPSGQDRAVASAASGIQVDAQRELSQQELEEQQASADTAETKEPPRDKSTVQAAALYARQASQDISSRKPLNLWG